MKKNLDQSDNTSSADPSIKDFYIQAGAFSSEDNATNLINKLTTIIFKNSLNIRKINKNSLYLVTIGPYDTQKFAEKALKDISKKIQLNSFIISE